MDELPAETPAERLRIAFELHELATSMLRQNWLRRHPGASADEVEAAVWAWLSNRPGAEHGDCDGLPVAWPRGE
ncbi:MAG TPA: hypothetical protein VE129_08240 [Thermoanaerobaculia bacterium]|nr:hypothetical protein [Thermoanaerobaculia bacterium]